MNGPLLQNSLLVSGATTVLAVGLGLVVALWLATLAPFRRNVFLGLAIVTLALPPFLVTNCWLDLLGDNGALQGWLPVRIYSLAGTIWILVLMLWPITLFAVLSAWQRLEAAQFECEPALIGFALLRWLLLPAARGEMALAAVLTFVLALNNFAVPAILQSKVLPDEVWVRFNTQFDTWGALRLSLPLVIVPLVLLGWVSRLGVRWPRVRGTVSAIVIRRQFGVLPRISCAVVAIPLVVLSVGMPLAQIVLASRTWVELPGAIEAGTGAIWHSFWFAAAAAMVVVGIGLLLATSIKARWLTSAVMLSWLSFLIPGVLIGIALIHGFNRPVLAGFYQSAGIVLLAFVIRYAALGITSARRALEGVDADLTDAARMEGAGGWQLFRLVQWPQIAPQIAAAWYVVYLLCLWDVESMVLVVPPGGETLALRIFNLLHYGHATQVNALCVVLLGVALGPLLIWCGAVWMKSKSSRFQPWGGAVCQFSSVALALGISFGTSGCSRTNTANQASLNSQMFERAEIIGSRGVGVGEFNKPRSVAVDRDDNIFAVDFTGRVQKFAPDGKFLLSWQMPETQQGKPKGMGRDHNGNIIIVEPHYQRVNHFTPDGRLVGQWGCRGTNEGCFLLPRGAAENSHGEFFVSEYMGAERVQRFVLPGLGRTGKALTPALSHPMGEVESQGRPNGTQMVQAVNARIEVQRNLNSATSPADGERGNISLSPAGSVGAKLTGIIGAGGTGPGEFNRAEGLCVDRQDRIYVADSCNHRIEIFSSDGKFIREYGHAGTGLGELSYPYDIAVDAQGFQFVCEFGNSRIQIFDSNCKPVEIIGQAGAAPGQFSNPWSVALDSHGNLVVADALNHRVQKLVRRGSSKIARSENRLMAGVTGAGARVSASP